MLRKVLIYPLIVAMTWFVCDLPFFWDTVQLASKHGHFFYESNFNSIILPEAIDSGHPPLFGMYVAFVWKLFGKSLCVSHFAMLPFLLGIAFFVQKLGEHLVGARNAPWVLLLCFSDPVLLGQSILVSPDIVLVFFFLGALYAIFKSKELLLSFCIIGLTLTSTRGMMVALALYGFSVFTSIGSLSLKTLFKRAIPFLPGCFLAGVFLVYHWQVTGWIGHHENSTWAPSFAKVDFWGFAKNLAVLSWRFLDFGRVFILIGMLVILFVKWKGINWKAPKMDRQNSRWQLAALAAFLFLALVPLQLQYKGLLAHRYFLPIFLIINILLVGWVVRLPVKITGPLLFLASLGLATGNFWVYPAKISMGWDSTLAHLPWYGLQNQVQNYLAENSIPMEKVGTVFPNIGPREIYELNGIDDGFVEKDLDKNCYVFYSNIMNDFTDEEIDLLHADWQPIFESKEGGIIVKLFKNPTCK